MSPPPRRLTFAVSSSLLTASLAVGAAGCDSQPQVNPAGPKAEPEGKAEDGKAEAGKAEAGKPEVAPEPEPEKRVNMVEELDPEELEPDRVNEGPEPEPQDTAPPEADPKPTPEPEPEPKRVNTRPTTK